MAETGYLVLARVKGFVLGGCLTRAQWFKIYFAYMGVVPSPAILAIEFGVGTDGLRLVDACSISRPRTLDEVVRSGGPGCVEATLVVHRVLRVPRTVTYRCPNCGYGWTRNLPLSHAVKVAMGRAKLRERCPACGYSVSVVEPESRYTVVYLGELCDDYGKCVRAVSLVGRSGRGRFSVVPYWDYVLITNAGKQEVDTAVKCFVDKRFEYLIAPLVPVGEPHIHLVTVPRRDNIHHLSPILDAHRVLRRLGIRAYYVPGVRSVNNVLDRLVNARDGTLVVAVDKLSSRLAHVSDVVIRLEYPPVALCTKSQLVSRVLTASLVEVDVSEPWAKAQAKLGLEPARSISL